MFFLIILLPLLGFFGGSLFGRFLGNEGVCYITVSGVLLAFLFSFRILINYLIEGHISTFFLCNWICVDTLFLSWKFYFDGLTIIILNVVTFISFLVHLYSIEYMSEDPHLPRFMSYLSLFTFFMLLLVTANNFLQMFVGWEGVGISSYLLINFWFTRLQANKAAIKAMLVNRIGDLALLIAIFAIFFVFNSLDYEVVFSLVPKIVNLNIIIFSLQIPILDFIAILLFFGAMGKSAQIGLHTWLPDAMEGPTPVSALIHAATMVTAGVFLVARCSYIFESSLSGLILIAVIGACTAFMAAGIGLFQNDLKKVIAYSTCSQLGYMMFACGLSSYDVGIFHLSNHAFFKALLFLGAGSVIHAVSDEQDLRKLGGLRQLLPFSYSIMLIGSLALIGFPFLAGFYSKDIILELSFVGYTVVGQFSYILGILAAFATAYYSTRVLYLTFLINSSGSRVKIFNVHEGGWKMTVPLSLLAFFSITVGYLTKEWFIGFGTDFWNGALFIYPQNYLLSDIEFLNLFFKQLPLFVTILGCFSAFFIYRFNANKFFLIKKQPWFLNLYYFLSKKWFFDRIYNEVFVQKLLDKSLSFYYQNIDRGLLEKMGPLGVVDSFSYLYKRIKGKQSGYVIHYLGYICFTILFFAIYLLNALDILFFMCLLYLYFITLIKKNYI